MRRLPLLLLLTLTGLTARAQTVPAAGNPPPQEEPTPFLSGVRGLFDFDLPSIDPPGTMKLILHPHFGDLVRKDYMRVEGGVGHQRSL